MLKRISLKSMILSGFGLVLGLLVIIAGVGLHGTSTIGRDFDGYRQAARESLLVGRANAAMLQVRQAVMQYRISNDDQFVISVDEQIAEIDAIMDDMHSLIEDPGKVAELEELSAMVREYRTFFSEAVTLQRQRNSNAPQLSMAGLAARDAISGIMDSAYRDGNQDALYHSGIVQQHLALAYYYGEKFLLENTPESRAQTLDEIAAANEASQILLANLRDPGRRSLFSDFRTQWTDFAAQFETIEQLIAARNAILHGHLDQLGPQIAAGYDTVLTAAVDVQNTTGPRGSARIAEVKTSTTIIAAMAIVLGTIAALVIGRFIAGSISRSVEKMKDLAAGQLDVEIEGGDRKDELGDMARALSVFQHNGHEKIRLEAEQVEQAARAEEDKRRMMHELADGFEASVNDVVSAVSRAADLMVGLSQTLSEATGKAGERSVTVAAASEEASTNVETVAAASEEMTNSIAEVSQRVGQSATMADNAAQGAERTTQTVSKLATSAQTVGEVISLISAIADQTNLLALNATIEAARAGEAGKGFAVVASEVKSLANQTAKATEEISAQITDMQGDTGAVVEAIDQISGMIQELNSTSSSIAAAVEEQHSATQEITRNTQQAADGTRQVSSNITEIAALVQETGDAASEVLEASSQLASEADRLRESVEQFLTTVRAA
jgi:methyl-accepting chemotaxis protein